MARKAKAPRMKIHEVTAENDIRFRGPLTFQHFQIFGWLCIVASQAALLLRIGAGMDPAVAELYQTMGPVLEGAANLSLPLLLIANFAQILDSSDGYQKQLIKNAGASLGVFLASVVIYNHYIVDALAAVSSNPTEARPVLDGLAHLLLPNRFISFNLFIDLFLCSLVMLFLNYQPKRFFRGGLLHVFRLFALLPIAYEVVCMVLKVQSAKGLVRLPLWCFPLLPVKPPMTFVLFLLLAAFVKVRELRFRRHGKTHEEYQQFLKTNKNSWNFSVFLAIMMVAVSLLDLLVTTGYTVVFAVQNLNESEIVAGAEASPSPDREAETEAEKGASLEEIDDQAAMHALLSMLAQQAATQESMGGEAADETGAPSEDMPDMETLILLSMLLGQPSSPEALPPADEAPAEPLTEEEKAIQEQERLSKALEAEMEKEINSALALGFGGSITMLVLAPLALLFSYTKTPRNAKVGMFIPMGGIILILILYLEAFRMALWNLPIPKLDLSEVSQLLRHAEKTR